MSSNDKNNNLRKFINEELKDPEINGYYQQAQALDKLFADFEGDLSKEQIQEFPDGNLKGDEEI